MSELSMMVTITERSKLTTFLSFYRERQVPVQFISLALGTASNETLNYLGLERSDKCVFASFVTDEKWEELRRGLRRELQIDVPGMGIAFTVPLSSIGGRRELQFLTEHQNYQKGEESTMKDTKYELLVVIANHGYSDLIMDAARGAGAGRLVRKGQQQVAGSGPAFGVQLPVADGKGAAEGHRAAVLAAFSAIHVHREPDLGPAQLAVDVHLADVAGGGGKAQGCGIKGEALQMAVGQGAEDGPYHHGGFGVADAAQSVGKGVPGPRAVAPHGDDPVRRYGQAGQHRIHHGGPGAGPPGEQ